MLVEHFVKELGRGRGTQVDGVTRDTMDVLVDYPSARNVRQLRNAIERACVTATGDRITYLDLPLDIRRALWPAYRRLGDPTFGRKKLPNERESSTPCGRPAAIRHQSGPTAGH